MQKKKSFISKILLYLLLLTGLLLVVLGVFLISSYEILEKEIKESSSTLLEIYSNEFTNNMTEMNSVLRSITAQGEDLAKLRSRDENERTLASISLCNYMQDLVSRDNVSGVIVVYDRNYNVCLDAIEAGFDYEKKIYLREFTRRATVNVKIRNHKWDFMNFKNDTYMYKIILTGRRAIAIYIRTNNLMDSTFTKDNGNRSIVLANNQGEIGKVWGNANNDIKVGADISLINSQNYYKIMKRVADSQLAIYCYTSKISVLKQTHTSMIIVGFIVCSAVLFMLFILKFTRNKIAAPMQIIVNDMVRIKNGEYDNRIDGDFQAKEFQMLQDTTNQMIDEIVGLKIQTYEKRIELQNMELKSIRLQLKPHFFLNALTTISSLSSQNKNMQIKTFIDALSKNVRYMFRAGFHTVPVKEEVKHVENYIEMQELKYPGCVFYLIDLPQELAEWKIPQMLIHTFVENEYKYAVSVENTLTVLIKIRKLIYKEEEMLMVEIEDDGKGYPREVLDYMNGFSNNNSESGTRIGLWSIKRMMELMYERSDLVVLENIEPHGCRNRIYVPAKAKHELAEETIQTKI
jgi:Putative regulator of cell autolysis